MNSESVDCIATDPPYNAKRLFNAPLGSRAAEQRFDDRWHWDEVTDEWYDLIATDHPAIKEIIEAAAVIEGGRVDRNTGKISTGRVRNSIAAYLAWMAPRIVEMHRLLKPTGVLFLQCNWEADSYLRLLLDAVFGRDKLINEIAWKSHPSKGLAKRRLPRNHGTILAYGKTMKWKWRPSHEPYDLKRLQQRYTKDEIARLPPEDQKTLRQYDQFDGLRRYRRDNLQNPNRNRPNLTYEFLGVTRVWRWTKERMEAAHAAGRIIQTRPGNVPDYKRYLDEQPGRPRDDVWLDVMQPESSDSEWTTRKPIALYQRLIQCATDEGDVVLDPFCGCATTLVAAEHLEHKREWVGIDIDPVAETETEKRLYETAGLDGYAAPVTVRKSIRRTDIPSIPDGRTRQALWARQGRRCANPYCDSENLRAVDMHLDHRIPRVRGGNDDVMNRIALCGNCNTRKGKKAWGQFLDEERSGQPHPAVKGPP
ncbi:MAG: DNA methyltransferase [bacterium]|nr:DNA methyltransferase [bacterium]MDE0240649.1 DNA methyltransferase [bacterium]